MRYTQCLFSQRLFSACILSIDVCSASVSHQCCELIDDSNTTQQHNKHFLPTTAVLLPYIPRYMHIYTDTRIHTHTHIYIYIYVYAYIIAVRLAGPILRLIIGQLQIALLILWAFAPHIRHKHRCLQRSDILSLCKSDWCTPKCRAPVADQGRLRK